MTPTRLGFKGPDAPALLEQQGLRIPTLPNRVVHWQATEPWGSGRCLRQGSTEFLVELDTRTAPQLSLNTPLPRAWTLVRSDHSLVLEGSAWRQSLPRICSFDFDRLRDEPDLVVMTLMAGISVTVIREPPGAANPSTDMALRLWCDASFSIYLQECLRSLGESR
jgi:sarcosine oxidase subunit gamma